MKPSGRFFMSFAGLNLNSQSPLISRKKVETNDLVDLLGDREGQDVGILAFLNWDLKIDQAKSVNLFNHTLARTL